MNQLNPNFFFLKDSYPELYEQCKNMDICIVNEKYNQSVILSKDILHNLLKIVLNTDDDLNKLVDRICKINSTASEIGLYIQEINTNSQKAIQNARRYSKSKAIKNAELVYEVVSYFLYMGVNPLNPYEPPQYYDDWVKKEIAEIRALEEYETNFIQEEPKNLEFIIEEFIENNKSKLSSKSQEQLDFIASKILELEKEDVEKPEIKDEKSDEKIAIEVKTGISPTIRFIIPKDKVDDFNPIVEIDYIED